MKRTAGDGRTRIDYTLSTRSGAETARLIVRPDGIRLEAPSGMTLKEADAFVLKNAGLIARETERIRPVKRDLSDGSAFPFAGRMYAVRRVCAPDASVSARDGELLVQAPDDEAARSAVISFLSRETLVRVRAVLNELCPDEKPYTRVTVREMGMRWGSLRRDGSLSFNWKLILAPNEALRYVAAHEIAHFEYFNHSQRFFRALGRRMPDYEPWMIWLKKYGKTLDL